MPARYPRDLDPDPHQSVLPELRTPEARARFLSRALIGTTLHFTPVLGMWVGCRLRRLERVAITDHALTEQQARLLHLDPGTVVSRREGWLVPATDRRGGLRLAAITSLVYEPRLDLAEDARALLAAGKHPLGTLVTGRRTTITAYPVPSQTSTHEDGPGDPWMPAPLPDLAGDVAALRSVGFLHRGGMPFALAAETVYQVGFDRIDVAAVGTFLAPLLAGIGVA
ncbi:hypothetical protein [Umezawaea sp. Da 62-37]|uniref:hypothetical protein n=1 Tax=Umezawaea sp. Da 62-37 TaxID=3075927 RepID=UPI0028F6F86F|nr:hypothetical protein [Umezawaea sp. Da 62-37]WNV83063.1 hypothetical protein RM788_33395 [Umezawaea sp. Da 62-37]